MPAPISPVAPLRLNTYMSRDYREVPPPFLCPITLTPMRHPTFVNCKEGHTFEGTAIREWMKQHKTCPLDRSAIDDLAFAYNRNLADAIEWWRTQSAVKEIDPESLAHYILDLGQLPNITEDLYTELGTYLRSLKTAAELCQVIAHVVSSAITDGIKVPDLTAIAKPATLDEHSWAILQQIIQQAQQQITRCDQMIDSGLLGPGATEMMESLMNMAGETQTALQALQALQADVTAMKNQLNDCARSQQQIREEAQRRALAQAERTQRSVIFPKAGELFGVTSPGTVPSIGRATS